MKDEDHAEEIVQDTFVAALQAKESFAGRSSEKTWLFGILKNKTMDHFRRIKKNRTYDLEVGDDRDPCASDFDGKGGAAGSPAGSDPGGGKFDKQCGVATAGYPEITQRSYGRD